MKIDDGSGLYSLAGMCDRLLSILNNIEIRGAQNCYYLYLVGSGIEHIRDTIKKNGWEENGQDHIADQDEAENV